VTLNMGMYMPSWVRTVALLCAMCWSLHQQSCLAHVSSPSVCSLTQYDIVGLSDRDHENCDGIDDSREVLLRLIEEVRYRMACTECLVGL